MGSQFNKIVIAFLVSLSLSSPLLKQPEQNQIAAWASSGAGRHWTGKKEGQY